MARALEFESDKYRGKTWHRKAVQINGEPREVKGHPAAVALAVLSTTYWDLVDQGEIGNLLSVECEPVPEEPATFEEDLEDGIYYDDATGQT